MRSVVQIKVEDVWPGDVLEMEQGCRRRVLSIEPLNQPSFCGADVWLVMSDRGEQVYSLFNWDETVWVVR